MEFILNDYIEINPNVRFGRPLIKGTRISVADILELFASGMTATEIIVDFPQLSEVQILSCLKYAANKENIWAVTA